MVTRRIPYSVRSLPEERMTRYVQAASDHGQNEKHVEKTKSSPSQKSETSQRKRTMAEKGEKIKKDLDKIMDEIDDVLEENAEEFIRSYVQRGGE